MKSCVNIQAEVCHYDNGDFVVKPMQSKRRMDERVQQGRVMTESDGTSHFKAYRKSGRKAYEIVFQTPNAEVKTTCPRKNVKRKKIIVKMSLPAEMGMERVCREIGKQMCDILDYLEMTL